MALESFPPAILMCTRYFLSGAILLIVAKIKGSHIPRGRELRWSALCGVLIIGVGTGALVYAEQTVPSGLASLIITLSPFWFVTFEALLPGGAPIHAPTIVGMIVGFGGASLLLLPSAGSAPMGLNLLKGILVLQIGMIGWCLGSILQRRQPVEAHPIVMGAVQQVASSVAFLPVAILAPHPPIVFRARAVWALAYLVVFGAIIGYSAYAYAISRLPVAVVSIYPYINAVVAVALGWLVYREPFGRRQLLAMFVIFCGVAIVKWQNTKFERSGVSSQSLSVVD